MTHGADAAVDHIFRRKSGILQQLYANALQVHMEFRTFLHDERMHLCTEQLFHRFRHIRISLEALLPDGRTEHGDQAFTFCAELLCHHIDGFRQDTCRHAAPTGMTHACGMRRRII